jgi:hypothetical protein
MNLSRRGVLGASAALGALPAVAATKPVVGKAAGKKKPLLAPTPPMGWNSWNSFATTITEAQTLEQAGIMARELLPAGTTS